jgi:hypothetical protein
VLYERIDPPSGDPQSLTPDQFHRLVEWVDELRPPYPRPTAHEIALEIDRRLSRGDGDGWRYDILPPDREAFALALDEKVTPEQATRFREDLLAEVTEIAYAHPEVQYALGYVGFADAYGWRNEGREAWE